MSGDRTTAGNREPALAAAARWFAARRRTSDLIEEQQFSEWLRAEPDNRPAYEEVSRSWDVAGLAATDPTVKRMCADALAVRPEKGERGPLRVGLAAAALAAVVVTGVSLTNGGVIGSAGQQQAQRDHFLLRTAVGERATASLEDGSTVMLNTNSALEVDFTRARRDVRLLAGQAFFRVAHDTARPFVVAAAQHEVVAVGTEFEVRIDGEKVRVALLEGRVRVQRTVGRGNAPRDAAMMSPGEQLIASSSGVTIRHADVNQLESWRSGRIRFDNTRLRDAVQEMNRYNHTPIEIEDGGVGDTMISGSFRTGESWSFAEAVSEAFDLTAVSNGDSILLKRRNKQKTAVLLRSRPELAS